MAEMKPGDVKKGPHPTLSITPSASAPFKVGRHKFKLQVKDSHGQVSDPVTAEVQVVEKPRAVIDIDPKTVGLNKPFTLSGKRSTATRGSRIVEYIWERVD